MIAARLAFIGGGHITEILLHNLVRAAAPVAPPSAESSRMRRRRPLGDRQRPAGRAPAPLERNVRG